MDGATPGIAIRDGLGETHAEIVRHASCLFATMGYTKTNIGEIAERVGMSPGNLYRYYRNKQAIGEEVVRCYLHTSESTIQTAVTATGPGAEGRLRAVFAAGIGGLIEALRKNPHMVELADMICAGDSGILSAHLDWKHALFARLLREGEAEGIWRFEDADAMAGTLMDATVAFWMPNALAQFDLDRVPGRVEGVIDALMTGWRTAPGRCA